MRGTVLSAFCAITLGGGWTGAIAMEVEVPVIIAHRGASAEAPENTAAAIKLALEQGARVIEFDVRETSDGVLALFHDEDFERFGGTSDRVESKTWAELCEMDVGSWFDPKYSDECAPTLEQAIRLCLEGGAIPLIERKSGSAENYASLIQELGVVDEVIVQAFDWEFLKETRKLIPELRIGALGKRSFGRTDRAELRLLKPDWVGWKDADFTESGLQFCKDMGCRVAIWTVNDRGRAELWLSRSADGIITDRPADMLALLAERDNPDR
ncbi:MAG: glycerophosphodiester phosphodiesterase family protein [Verrucomicrobiota bacterium]